MYNLKTVLCAFVGMLGAFITNMFGGWTTDMETLLIFMRGDIK